MKKALFIDRDGTIIAEPADEQIDSLEKLAFVPGAISALKALTGLGFDLVLATNQDGLGTPSFPEDTFWPAHEKMLSTLGGDDKALEAIASQQRIEMMMRPLEAWSNQRRTGYPALEVPASIRNFYPGIMHRWPYPEREGSVNDNVPHVDGVWTKMWFEN